MSKGSERIILRIPDGLIDEIDIAVYAANLNRKDEPYNRSSWIRAAICAKLNHRRRSMREEEQRLSITYDELAKLELLDE